MKRPTRPIRLLLALLAVAAAPLGCGDQRAKRARVQGTVTVGGRPLTQGVIMFYPTAGGRPATGQIDADGTYELTTYDPGDGALLGDHAVTIEAVEVNETSAPPASLLDEVSSAPTATRPPQVRWLVPEDYADRSTSPLTAVVEDKDNTIDFPIE